MVEETGILHEPTVLVLGAGASRPHGFPLGPELKNAMINNSNDAAVRALGEIGQGDTAIKEFRRALRFTEHTTIDSFLEAKTNLREIGAYFIAGTIGNYEVEDRLFPKGDWYADLILALGLEDVGRHLPPVSVVTLNYDRSIEHFLAMHIDFNCPHSCVELAHRKRQSLPIIHAHGSLGAYPQVEYGRASSGHGALREAAKSIRIVSDRLEESPDFQRAQQALAEAKHIIFLGFGYDKRTLQLLLRKVTPDGVHFYGTAFGIGGRERDDVTGLFKPGITLGDTQQGCKEFVRRIGLVPEDTPR